MSMTDRERMKGSPMTLSTNLGGPRDPNEPTGSLEAWCAYHGIPLTDGGAPGPAAAKPPTDS